MAQKRIALVTGGSRGIGFGCSLALARQGFDLVVAGRRPESDCAEALAELRACLRERFEAAPLRQIDAFATSFEKGLRRAWQGWCEQVPPAAIDVA